jgi:hypothetical protein
VVAERQERQEWNGLEEQVSDGHRAKQRQKDASGYSPPTLRRKREETGGDLNLLRPGVRRETEGGGPPPAENRLGSHLWFHTGLRLRPY